MNATGTVTATAKPTTQKTVSYDLKVMATLVNESRTSSSMAEGYFARLLDSAVEPHHARCFCVGVDEKTDKGWPVRTLVIMNSGTNVSREDLPKAKESVSKLAPIIKNALRVDFKDVRVELRTVTTESEVL